MDEVQAPATAEGMLDRLGDFLDRLVGPDQITITDITGKQHRIRATMPARVEGRFWRTLKGMDSGVLEARVNSLRNGASDDALSSIMSLIMDALSNEAILDAADRAFTDANPDVVAAALANADAAGITGLRSAQDVFSLAEIALGLSPFVVAGLQGMGRLIRTYVSRPT